MRYDQVNGILLNEVLKEDCTLDQPERRKIYNPPYLRLLQWLLNAIAILVRLKRDTTVQIPGQVNTRTYESSDDFRQ